MLLNNELIVLTRKLAVLTTFFGGGSANSCSSLLIEGSIEDWMEFWNIRQFVQ